MRLRLVVLALFALILAVYMVIAPANPYLDGLALALFAFTIAACAATYWAETDEQRRERIGRE
jgi:hypothetical protein